VDQLRHAFEKFGVTKETLVKSTIKKSLGFLISQTTLPKDIIVSYLKERFRDFKEYPEETPLYRISMAFSKSSQNSEDFTVFLEKTSDDLQLSKGTILLMRNEWGLKRAP